MKINGNTSSKYDIWSSTPIGNKKLDAAFSDVEAKASEKVASIKSSSSSQDLFPKELAGLS